MCYNILCIMSAQYKVQKKTTDSYAVLDNP